MTPVNEGDLLWQPDQQRIDNAAITGFMAWINHRYNTQLDHYQQFWQWSIDDISRFWEALAEYYQVFDTSRMPEAITESVMPGAQWFAGSRVNFAEYTLRQGSGERTAVFVESEGAQPQRMNWDELREQVVRLASYLRDQLGIQPGDHVCTYLPVSCEAVVTLLATASIGAVWSSCSPDFGSKSVYERFSQVSPKVLIAVAGYTYNGKFFDRSAELNALVESLDSLQQVIYLPWIDKADPQLPAPNSPAAVTSWAQAIDNDARYEHFQFAQLAFDHPIWVLYTSGTTGLPKGIVHSQGGILLEFIKSGFLHDDLNAQSVKFFFTTTGWTMFNLLLGGLVTGSAIVLYDGCPTYPGPHILFDIAERCGVTYFGANPTFVNGLMSAGYSPKGQYDLSRIKTIALTGSPSAPETFQWFYDNLHDDLHIVSMSGGTDVAAAFVGGAPILPVHAGEIQAPCLAVEARAFDDDGNILVDEYGELVVTQPMPSMPICFLGDTNNERYLSSYFDMFPGIWRQGDLVRFRPDGRCVISGRSDSTLNRYGIRVGSSEIYRTVEAIDGISDSLIVNLELPGAQFFMPLFVVLEQGAELSDELVRTIASQLRSQCSPRHVPDKVYVIDEVPYTLSGKKLEVPVKRLLSGVPLEKAANLGACRNPASLDYFIEFAKNIEQEY